MGRLISYCLFNVAKRYIFVEENELQVLKAAVAETQKDKFRANEEIEKVRFCFHYHINITIILIFS
jgi:hypothetical protein